MLDLNEEQKLVERAQKDIQAFGKLYDYYVKKVYSFVFYMVQNHTETEDVVSETFEKVINNLEKYEFRGYSFGAWIFKIARNIVYDRSKARKETSLDAIENLEVVSNSETPEEKIISDEQREFLIRNMMDLKDEQREIIYLRYVQDYSIKEVCEMTGKTEDSVKSLAKRGISRLRELSLLSNG